MQFTIDQRVAADVTQRIVEAMTESLCASTPMLSWSGARTDDGGVVSSSGSAFLVRTPAGILCVTAGHVMDAFVVAQKICADITATLGGFSFDLEDRLIERGQGVDIATFRMGEADLPMIGFRPLERAWPPTTPANRGIVLLAGWPGHERIVGAEELLAVFMSDWDQQAFQTCRSQSGLITTKVRSRPFLASRCHRQALSSAE